MASWRPEALPAVDSGLRRVFRDSLFQCHVARQSQGQSGHRSGVVRTVAGDSPERSSCLCGGWRGSVVVMRSHHGRSREIYPGAHERAVLLLHPTCLRSSPPIPRPDIFRKAQGDVDRANVEEVDTSVGCVLDTLRELDIAKNTLVLFTSDNGGARGMSMGPLRGGKGGPKYEGHMRVPTVAWWPGTIKAGTRIDAIGTTVDLLPTIAKLTFMPGPVHVMIRSGGQMKVGNRIRATEFLFRNGPGTRFVCLPFACPTFGQRRFKSRR